MPARLYQSRAPFLTAQYAYNLACSLFARSIVRLKFSSIPLLVLVLSVAPFSSPQAPTLPPIAPSRRDSNPDIPNRAQKEMEKKANEQRQADLKRDADKLLQLSTELKQYVDKSNEYVLSVDVLRKAEEIEKLAHSVKTKMRGDN